MSHDVNWKATTGAADAAGAAGMKIGGKFAGNVAKKIFSKEVLALFKRIAAKVGVKILQRTIVKYTVPLASIGIGFCWNYLATRSVGRIAVKHFKQRIADVRVMPTPTGVGTVNGNGGGSGMGGAMRQDEVPAAYRIPTVGISSDRI